MGNCCSGNYVKPIEQAINLDLFQFISLKRVGQQILSIDILLIVKQQLTVQTKNARECIQRYKYQQSLPRELKDQQNFQYIFQFTYKDSIYQILGIYEEPVKIPDPLFINLDKDQWEKYVVRKVYSNHDIKNQSKQEQDEVIMMSHQIEASQMLHEKQIRFFEKLNHPNLVKYYSHTQINFKLVAFKELCEQGSLLRYLERCRNQLNADLIFDLLEDLCSALRYLYSRAVVDFKLNVDMLCISDNRIKIDLYNWIKIDDKTLNQLQDEPNNINDPTFTNLLLKSRVALPAADYQETPQAQQYNQKSRVGLDHQSKTVSRIQQKYKVDENQIDIEFVRLFCLYLLFKQDYKLLTKPKQESNCKSQGDQQQNLEEENTNDSNINEDIDVQKIKEVKKAPKKLSEFIVWTLHHIKSLRPNITEIHKDIAEIRYDPEVVSYINKLYSTNKTISLEQQHSGYIDDGRVQKYKSHYRKNEEQQNNQSAVNHQNSINNQQENNLNRILTYDPKQFNQQSTINKDFNRIYTFKPENNNFAQQNSIVSQEREFNRILTYNPNQHQNHNQHENQFGNHNNNENNQIQIQNEEDIINQLVQQDMQNSKNADLNKTGGSNMMDSQNRGSQNIIKIWEEIPNVNIENVRSNFNPNELLKQQFFFFEETYEILSYLNTSQMSVYFRVENIFLNRQKAFTLKISKNADVNLFLEKEYTILKQFGCHNIITAYSFVNIGNLSGLILDLYHQTFLDYIKSSSKLDIAVQLIDYLSQFLNGLHELHVKNIIHRSITLDCIAILPATLSLNRKQVAALSNLDFAIQLKNTDQISGEIPVNPYTAPEIKEGQKYGLSSDVFSAGLIILSTLCNVSAQKLLSIVNPELNLPSISQSNYVSHIQNTFSQTKSNYQKAFESSIKKNNRNNDLMDSKRNQNVMSSTIKNSNQSQNQNQNTLFQSCYVYNIGQPQSKLEVSRMRDTSYQNRSVVLRDVLGDKCPPLIIDSFENMISKNPEQRGNCSDYLNAFSLLKQSPESIQYINMQNKQIRFI